MDTDHNMSAFECYREYVALKQHFTQPSFDYFKYNGKSNVSVDAFENRKDKYHFYKLSRKYQTKDEYVNFLVANLFENSKSWAGDLLQEEAHQIYLARQKVIQSMSYTFENECRNIFDGVSNPNDIILTDGDYPILLTKTLRSEVSIETLCLLNGILNF